MHNQLGWNEDSPPPAHHIRALADCGDLPYLLRAYFSWKFGLSFRYSECSRGTGKKGPQCSGEIDNESNRHQRILHPVKRMNHFLEVLTWKVHSGTFRTLPGSETSDFYPIALKRSAILPGTVFVDSGGHILMISQWNAEGLFAVDGHPDKTVTRRSFKPKFFPVYPKLSTGGFKAFRPFEYHVNSWVPTPNRTLTPVYSDMQYAFSSRQSFYNVMIREIQKLSVPIR
ncbi:MAG: hypothetical protein JXX29_13975 [Deltaproteobacteria bacterium]|nr:hypothetical protein [Deltaproteobacteria bacterium]MBN2672785.1 hypothetical protein [Deltaproteobacteria bacterium]